MGELCAVTILFATVFTALHLEDDYLVTLNERSFNLCYYFGAVNCWRTYCDSSILVYKEDLVELNSFVLLDILDVMNKQRLAFFGFKLLTVNLYDCVHFIIL